MPADPKSLTIGVPRETAPGERRVALVPDDVRSLKKAGIAVLVESGAGVSSGFTDAAYNQRGAQIVPARGELDSTDGHPPTDAAKPDPDRAL